MQLLDIAARKAMQTLAELRQKEEHGLCRLYFADDGELVALDLPGQHDPRPIERLSFERIGHYSWAAGCLLEVYVPDYIAPACKHVIDVQAKALLKRAPPSGAEET